MSNVIVAIVALIITFILASYGVYQNVESSRRTQQATVIGTTLNREAQQYQDMAFDLARPIGPRDTTNLTAPEGYDQTAMFARDSSTDVAYSAVNNAQGSFVCATASSSLTTISDAMNMVVRDRPGSFVSGACGVSSTAVGSSTVVSMKVG